MKLENDISNVNKVNVKIATRFVISVCKEIGHERLVKLLNCKSSTLYFWRARGCPFFSMVYIFCKFPDLLVWKDYCIETPDDLLRFAFTDHKIKGNNASSEG